jgi:membrane fusion protein (multidrug efflux system)
MKRNGMYLASFLMGLFVWGCNDNTPKNEDAALHDPVVSVQVALIVRKTLTVALVVDGVTDVRDRETVMSPIDGTIVSLSVEVGATVDASDTLAVIRTRSSEASISGARRLLEEAATPRQRDDARRAMQVAEENQQVVPVVARRHGVVVDRMVSIEQAVTTNSDLLQLVDLSTLDFVANVPPQDLTRVKIGQSCLVRFPSLPDRSFAGTVTAVSAQSDQGSQATPVWISFQPQASVAASVLRMGMMGTAAIKTGERPDVLVVPVAALLRDDINDTYTIYTVGADSLARKVLVTIGIVNDSLAEVAAPSLRDGEFAIVKGNYEVSDSTRVTIEAVGNQ